MQDVALQDDEMAKQLIGTSPQNLRNNLSRLMSGHLTLDGQCVSEMKFDLRVGSPPAEDPDFSPESLNQLCQDAWGMQLDAYAKEVKKRDHWGCETDLAVTAACTNRVWQMGKIAVGKNGSTYFMPTLQLTPPWYDFDSHEFEIEPIRVCHENGNHFNAFAKALPVRARRVNLPANCSNPTDADAAGSRTAGLRTAAARGRGLVRR